METILAGETLSATVLNNWNPQALTDTATAETNWTVNSFTVYWIAGVTWFSITLAYSGSTITADASGNITATPCVTLPTALQPQAQMSDVYLTNNNAQGGLLSIGTNGVCTLRTLSPSESIASGASVSFSGTILTG